jgi:2-dehydro-3-deoxyphosphogluconate aldolase/(4S)-4-hydroxy-2-oxoglutarate aldolase
LSQQLNEAAFQLVEVTFDQQDPHCVQKTSEALQMLNATFSGRAFGAGTVLTRESGKKPLMMQEL